VTAALRAAVEYGKRNGHTWLLLVIRRSRMPKRLDCVRVLPGCYGHVAGPIRRGALLVDVKLADLDRALRTKGPADV
jgi:hypothetical protein